MFLPERLRLLFGSRALLAYDNFLCGGKSVYCRGKSKYRMYMRLLISPIGQRVSCRVFMNTGTNHRSFGLLVSQSRYTR